MISMTVFFNTGGCGRPWACLWYSWLVISPKTDWVVSKTVHEQNRYFWIFNEYRILAYPNHIQYHIFCYIFEENTLGMSEVFVDSHISQNWLSSVRNCIVFDSPVRTLILTNFTLRARSPWVLRSRTIQAYLRDWYGSGIPKLCPYPDLDTKQIFWIRTTQNR